MSVTEQVHDKADLESPGASTIDKEDICPAVEKDWTDAEETRVRRKLDLIVMPLVMFGFMCFQIERGNISNAITGTFFKDIHINQDQFNTGVLYLGIVLLEIPSNILLQRVGPQLWLTFQVFCFGLVSMLQAFQKNYAGFLATRILLGVTECGYIPGALYLISTFYKRSELATRNACFFLGSGFASAITGLLAFGILRLAGKGGLKGWQWLFLLEGSFSVFCAILFLFFLPASPEHPTSILFPKLRFFSPRERYILTARVNLDDPAKGATKRPVTATDILSVMKNFRTWPHIVIAVCCIGPTSALGSYTPTLIKGFGFPTLKANALSSVPGWIGLFAIFFLGKLSDWTKLRGPVVILGVGIYWVFWVAFQQQSLSHDKWRKYALLVLTAGVNQAYHPANATWLSLNQVTPQHRSIAMAMFIMAANTGAAIGSQLLQKKDSPLYRTGFRACVALVSVALATAIGQSLQYWWSNKKAARRGDLENVETDRPAKYVF